MPKKSDRPTLANSICAMAGINRKQRKTVQYFTKSELLELHVFVANMVRENQALKSTRGC